MEHDYVLSEAHPNEKNCDQSSSNLDFMPGLDHDHDYGEYSKTDAAPSAGKIFQCYVCDSIYKHHGSLYKHMSKIHGLSPGMKTITCQECQDKFSFLKQLRQHLVSIHDQSMEIENLTFKDMSDFLTWKQEIEEKGKVRFINDTGAKKQGNGKVQTIYYRCSRSGFYKDHSKKINETRQRKIKCQGSDKINNYCTASITLRKNLENSQITVEFCKSHHGHDVSIGHIALSKVDRDKIASLRLQGVSTDAILDQVRDSVSSDFERIHLLTKKDVNNIEHLYGLNNKVEKNKDDQTSVNIWAIENSDCVIYHKKQHEPSEILQDEDFCLGIMSSAQAAMLQKFGEIICVDATHGTNPYDFKLITILIIDDYNEGFPAAYFYSTKEDETALTEFFKAVKKKLGVQVKCKTFMSDDAPQYFTAWVNVMGNEDIIKILCSWHIDRAWRKKLSLVQDKEKQVALYKLLKKIHHETNEEKFLDALLYLKNEFVSDPDLAEFGKYFNTHYGNPERYRQWSYCYRLHCSINTNMHLESMHRVIKYVYNKGVRFQRLDRSVHLLLKYIRDKQFERVRKIYKGKNTGKLVHIEDRHNKALKINLSAVMEKDDHYVVHSQRTCSTEYIVQKNDNIEESNHKCPLKCVPCNYCIHSFFCSCTDHIIKGEMCKHIHLVCRKRNEQLVALPENADFSYHSEPSNSCLEESSPVLNEINIHLESLSKHKKEVSQKKKEHLVTCFQTFIKFVEDQKENSEILDDILPFVKSINSVITLNKLNVSSKKKNVHELDGNNKENEGREENRTNLKSKIPANKKIDPQNKYRSIKKKKKMSDTPKLQLPNYFEKMQMEEEIQNKNLRI